MRIENGGYSLSEEYEKVVGSVDWLGSRGVLPSEVVVEYLEEKESYPLGVKRRVAEIHEELEAHPERWDGLMLSYKGVNDEEEFPLTIKASFVRYSAFKATNVEMGADNVGLFRYADATILSTIFLTNDSKIVVALRSDRAEYGGKRYGTFGGLANVDEGVRFPMKGKHKGWSLFAMLEHEIQEESGIPHDVVMEKTSSRLIAIARDPRWLSPNFIFVTKSSLDSSECDFYFAKQGRRNEHSAISFIENNARSINQFLQNNELVWAVRMGLMLYRDFYLTG